MKWLKYICQIIRSNMHPNIMYWQTWGRHGEEVGAVGGGGGITGIRLTVQSRNLEGAGGGGGSHLGKVTTTAFGGQGVGQHGGQAGLGRR